MKYCPQCQTTYTDDLLKYCLKDGAPLGEVFSQPAANDDERTVATIRQVEPIRIPVQQAPPPVEIPPVQNPPVYSAPPPNRQTFDAPVGVAPPVVKKSKTGLTVGLTILGTLLLLGVGGALAMLYFNRRQTAEVAAVNANKPANANRPANAANANAANTAKANQNSNVNATVASPTAAPTPKPALDPRDREAIVARVETTIDDWKSAAENRDIGGQLSQYAETVDYYRGGKVNRTRIRADKDRALGLYDSINIDISNLKVTPDASGENATAVFDKEWEFQGENKSSSGMVQQQLTLSQIDGRWLITGERDLKVYYRDK